MREGLAPSGGRPLGGRGSPPVAAAVVGVAGTLLVLAPSGGVL